MLRLVVGQGRIRDALTVTHLVQVIPTFETESAALVNFARLRSFLFRRGNSLSSPLC
jgi:hypothetical protein